MNIFLSFLQSPVIHPIPAYSFWEHYIKNGITETGHQWSECATVDWALGLVPKSKPTQLKWKENAWEQTIDHLKKHPADLFLSYLYADQIDITAINEIKRMGIPCVNFFCDNVRDFKKLPDEFAAFNLNWVPEHKALKLYQKAGYAYINLPMPIWIDPQLRVFNAESNQKITFIGSKEIQRLLFFEKVIQQCRDLPLAIYGNGWDEDALSKDALPPLNLADKLNYQTQFIKKNGVVPYLRKLNQRNIDTVISPGLKSKTQGAISFETYNKLTAQSMITVGINRYPSFHFPINKPDSYSRLRDIEAPMLGACYLTEWTAGIEDLYDIGNEIATYKSVEDFIDMVKELQSNGAKRKRLKVNGQKRALTDHSVPQSISKIAQKLFN